ncbi:MAG TPA: MBL fold metallo-hydrolase [Chitinophagales bacterium]|nr:MBL fold metallo-hydrolase [Chitinophagales bacterium]HMX05532.1 MBL fold metallo-hydrolase [Chitinophagales bacterium]
MKKAFTVYQNGNHIWRVIARDPEKPNFLIDTNEYLISYNGKSILTDPGGIEIFPAVFTAISSVENPESLTALFASHQDPDIISSLSMWLEFNPALPCYIPWLWAGFIPHFGGNKETFIPIADSGMLFSLNGLQLEAVPAHYLHSSGNCNLYDSTAKILFSGDIGAALLPENETDIFVKDFDRVIKAAEGFHRRWMGSEVAKKKWCERVSKMEIDMMCPQHGAIFQGADVERFINWFYDLKIGVLR